MGIEQMVYWNIDRWYKHYMYLIDSLERAIEDHEEYCMDPDCNDTNWGGVDRIHYRDVNECPEFVQTTKINYRRRLIQAEAWVNKFNKKTIVRQNTEDDAKINHYADKILEALK